MSHPPSFDSEAVDFDQSEIESLRARLEDAEDKLEALRSGAVDALVIQGSQGAQVYVLQSADHPYRLLIEQMPDAALTLDFNGNVLYCNPRAAEMFRSPCELIVGKPIHDYVVAGDHAALREALDIAQSGASRAELRVLSFDGHAAPAQFAFSPLRTTDFDGICLIVTDLTEHYRSLELVASARKKDEFMAMLAHEFRNPLAPIRNAVSVLKLLGPMGDERFVQVRELIGRQVDHLTRLVDDLLDVSRITQGKINLRMAPVDVNRVLAGGVEIARPLVDEYNHRLVVRPLADSVTVVGDFTRLVQVVGNLLNNAAKYTSPGGEITLSAHRDDGMVVVRVEDDGVGISADLLPHVFELFTQAPRPPDRAQGGLGIGLSLVHTIVHLHGGTVDAKSDGAQKGSQFTVRLPVAAAMHEAHPARSSAVDSRRRRILIVDDNRDAADSMATLLDMEGHDVHVAYEGVSGVSLALEKRIEIAFIDIGLPGIDGHEVARRLRQAHDANGMVLVALTGYGRDEDRFQSREAGFDHHLVKPVQWELLDRVLRA